jgi:hypothetical protein
VSRSRDLDPALIGAFLSGAAAVISALISLRITRKRAQEDCDNRVEEVKKTLLEGIELGRGP